MTMRLLRFRLVVAMASALLLMACARPGVGPETPSGLSALAGWKGTAPNSEKAFSFVVLSDRTGGHISGEWEQAIEETNLLKPDFVICVGDLVEGYTLDEKALETQWDEMEAYIAKLDAPFFFCPGNHDVECDKKDAENVSRKVYLRRHGVNGKTYYSFNYRECHFVVLDSVEAEDDPVFAKEQLSWLKQDLANSVAARHFFVFYHYPLWEEPKEWNLLRDALPRGKTTIFNGHWHRLRYMNADGFPTYVLACTAAGTAVNAPRSSGSYRMYARVAVDRGEPRIALVPLHEIEPADYAARISRMRDLAGWQWSLPLAVGVNGSTVVLTPANDTEEATEFVLSWKASGWTISPASVKLSLAAHAKEDVSFELKPIEPALQPPVLVAEYSFRGEHSKEEMRAFLWRNAVLGKLEKFDLDGNLDKWAAVPAVKLDSESQVFAGKDIWKGPETSSAEYRAAICGDALAISVVVTDPDIAQQPSKRPWNRNAVELFWDLRKPEARSHRMGPGTGQFIIQAMANDGVPDVMMWLPAGERQPKLPDDVKAFCHRTAKGYVIEALLPLADLGGQVNPVKGDEICLDLMLDGCIGRGASERLTMMSLSGSGDCSRDPGVYSHFRCQR